MKRLGFLALLLCVGCRYIEVIDDRERLARISDPARNRSVRQWVTQMSEVDAPPLQFQSGAPRDLHFEAGEAPAGTPQVVLSFVQISDVQLRDERVKLFGSFLSGLFDKVVQTNEYGLDQERFDSAVYLAMILGINKSFPVDEDNPKPGDPLFTVHTGDAVHTSVLQELWEFVWITDLLKLPWFNTIGNHDDTAFGTELGDVTLRDPKIGYLPIGGWRNFLNFHGTAAAKWVSSAFPPGIEVLPPSAQPHDATQFNFSSDSHGFDLNERKGYYALTSKQAPEWWPGRIRDGFPVRMLFLNSSEDLKLHQGVIKKGQLDWVKAQLAEAEAAGEFVIAFAHHGFDQGLFDDGHARWLRKIFSEYPRFLGLFVGHTHKQSQHVIRTDGGRPFWQIVAPSILEYPQAGLYHELLRYPDGRLVWRVTRFTNGAPEVEATDAFPPNPDDRLSTQAGLARRSAREDAEDRGRKTDQIDARPPLRLHTELKWEPR